MVSLDAQTTRPSRSVAAAMNTLKFMAMLVLKVTAGVRISGAGMFARCTTASAPCSASSA